MIFDTWHAIYLYFKAVENGDLQPMLDFMIDGKYDEEFEKKVGKEFGRLDVVSNDNLYLF